MRRCNLSSSARFGDTTALFTRKIRRFCLPRIAALPDSARGKLAEPAFPPLLVPPPGNHLLCVPNKKSIPANEAGLDNKSRFQFHYELGALSIRLAPPLERRIDDRCDGCRCDPDKVRMVE